MWQIIKQQQSVLYCSKIKSQALLGMSGDGQMLVNTGLLPIQTGVACMLYGENEYPNIAHYYNNSICINSTNNNVWNQYKMNYRYGYKEYEFPKQTSIDDAETFDVAHKCFSSKKGKTCVQIITVSTHVPFLNNANVNLPFKSDMPQNMRGYLNCVHYTDSVIGVFVNKLTSDSLLSNTTIVITGDHTIFKKYLLDEFKPFAEKYNYSEIPIDESYCPLIILSPLIANSVVINDICYQMDIYSTILHCIGIDDYYWKGFGVNLLDSNARKNRTISEYEAYQLSDKLIRSNYFGKKKYD